MANGAKANYAMSSALASFMQNQINTVTGRALSSMGLDLSANMESSADALGSAAYGLYLQFLETLA